jgi:predicted ATPase
MLKRIYIDNFRCFVNFEYKPERKLLLLGANGSGKSSLLDAIRAVQGFVREDGARDFNRIVFQDSKTRWLNLPKQVFEIEAELEGKQYVYRLEINAESNPKNLVLAESLKVDGNPILEYSNGYVFVYPSDAPGPLAPLMVEDAHTSMLGFLRSFRNEARRFVDWLSKELVCLRINPYAMKNTGKFTGGPAHPAVDLNNIADWYGSLTLHDSHGMFQLRSSLQEIFDGPTSLNFNYTETGKGDLIVAFNRPKDGLTFRLMELSEGQRCLIALYMILHFLIAKGHTVFIDEPDNFISLREIQPWLLAAEAAAEDSKGQLILISHHPEILNQLAQESGLRFFREENGHVRTEKFRTDPDGLLQPSELIARGWEND